MFGFLRRIRSWDTLNKRLLVWRGRLDSSSDNQTLDGWGICVSSKTSECLRCKNLDLEKLEPCILKLNPHLGKQKERESSQEWKLPLCSLSSETQTTASTLGLQTLNTEVSSPGDNNTYSRFERDSELALGWIPINFQKEKGLKKPWGREQDVPSSAGTQSRTSGGEGER